MLSTAATDRLARGTRVRLPGEPGLFTVDAAVVNDDGLDLYPQAAGSAGDSDETVRGRVASNGNCSAATLARLAGDSDSHVRDAAARNLAFRG